MLEEIAQVCSASLIDDPGDHPVLGALPKSQQNAAAHLHSRAWVDGKIALKSYTDRGKFK